VYSYLDIKTIHLEISTRCNAACPGCPRNLCGVDVVDDYPQHDMSLNEARTIFQPDFLKRLDNILINGNLGDFVTAQDGMKIVEYFLEQNPNLHISISTNASARPDIWSRLGQLGITVLFCIDGLKDTHNLYRQQTNWDMIIKNAKKFISAGGYAVWKMILFDHNQHQVKQCQELSKQLGFKTFRLVDHQRNAFPVFTQKKIFSHDIGEHTQTRTWNNKFQNWQECRENDKIDPVVEPKKINCQVQTAKSLYISATGEIYPCCWLGFYPRQMIHLGNSGIKKLLPENNNANQIGIEQSMSWFDRVEQSWQGNQQLTQCNTICGITE